MKKLSLVSLLLLAACAHNPSMNTVIGGGVGAAAGAAVGYGVGGSTGAVVGAAVGGAAGAAVGSNTGRPAPQQGGYDRGDRREHDHRDRHDRERGRD